MISKKLFTLLLLVSTTLLYSQTYKNPNAKVEDRVKDLLSKMTLSEKIGQMQQANLTGFNDKLKKDLADSKIGSFLNAGTVEDKHKLQKTVVEKSRLGIPLIFGRDVIHGFKTMLPIPLGQSASWNYDLIKQGAAMAAREAAEDGYHWTFAPMIDISRDPRWGRIAESCGEDPYLAGQLGLAMIEGFQGNDLTDANTIAACAKHYVGYGATEGGRDYNTTLIPERELRDIYLKPFKKAVDGGVATLMSAFNDLNGVPTTGNKFTLKTILRDEWKFDGFVVSDWGSINEMIVHGFAKDGSEAALKSANAGVNMEMVTESYQNNLKALVEAGKVSSEWLDEMVAGILRIKFKLGLFENPYTRFESKEKTLSDEYREIAKQAAIESVVMLKNEDNVLPLDKSVKSVAIIGPLADAPHAQLGTWNVDGEKKHSITPIMAIKKQYGNDVKINYVKTLKNARSTDKSNFDKAIEAAKNSDVVLLFLGEDELLSGETHCRAFIDLPGVQDDLVNEIYNTGKPTALILMAGRALTFKNTANKVNSILYAWHPGTMGGPALADIIFGKVSPSGKLTITFPRTVGQVPLYYNHKNTGRPAAPNQLGRKIGTPENPEGFASYYLDVDFTPAYYFGYGLSYSEFEYSDLKLSSNEINKGEKLEVTVNIKNTGDFEAKEITQLYIRDLSGSVTRPVKELKAFEKITLKPGEEKLVKFVLTDEDLKFCDIDLNYVSEAGDFEIFVGSSSKDSDLLKLKFVLK